MSAYNKPSSSYYFYNDSSSATVSFKKAEAPKEEAPKVENELDITKPLYTRLGLKVTRITDNVFDGGFIGRIEGTDLNFKWTVKGKSRTASELDIVEKESI